MGMNAKIDGKGGLRIKIGSSTVEAKKAWGVAKEALSTEPGFEASGPSKMDSERPICSQRV